MKYTYQVELIFPTNIKDGDHLWTEHVMTAPVWGDIYLAEHYVKRLINTVPSIQEFKIHRHDAELMPETHMWIEGEPVHVWTYNVNKRDP